jgi:hypothetical protein
MLVLKLSLDTHVILRVNCITEMYLGLTKHFGIQQVENAWAI